jgi:hypothetical protein
MTAWNDFNDADSQQSGFDLIPKGTVVPVRMTIKPGGYDDPEQGWGGGYATESFETGSIYLAAEFVVTAGDHAKRKMWSNIGLLSKKGPTWGQMGRSFIRAALNSARNVHPQDNSPQAAAARRINGFARTGRSGVLGPRRHREGRQGPRPQRGQAGSRARPPRLRQVDGCADEGQSGRWQLRRSRAGGPGLFRAHPATRTSDGQTVLGSVRRRP